MVQSYRYYDTPDGEDYVKKQYYLLKNAMLASGYLTVMDIYRNKTEGVIPIIHRAVTIFSKPLIAATIFGATVYISTKILRQDNPITHVYGAAATTYYISHFSPNTFALIMYFIPAAFALYTFKFCRMHFDLKMDKEHLAYNYEIDHTLFSDFCKFYWSPSKFEKSYLSVNEAIEKGLIKSKEDAIERGVFSALP